jgi:hypothetical protein
MASLSKSEIVQKYPIGRGLDVFRDSFSSTCAELGLRVSPDAVRQFSHKGEMS